MDACTHDLASRHLPRPVLCAAGTEMGLEGLLRERAFSVLVIEVDGSWGGVLPEWAISATDQLVWFCWRHRYRTFLKVPCPARRFVPDAMEDDTSAAYVPLLRSQRAFVPTNFHASHARGGPQIQDLVIVDDAQPELHKRLVELGRADCLLPVANADLNATRPLASTWLASARAGHCGATDGKLELADCMHGQKGAIGLHPDEARGGWESAASSCLTRCARCQRCQYVSLSLQWLDCSFYHACNLGALHTNVPGFRSGAMPISTRRGA